MGIKIRADVMAISAAGVLVAAAITFNALNSAPKTTDECMLKIAAKATTEQGARAAAYACQEIDRKYSTTASWLTGSAEWRRDLGSDSYRIVASVRNLSPDWYLEYLDVRIVVASGDLGGVYRAYCDNIGPHSSGKCSAKIGGQPPAEKDGWQWHIAGVSYR